jgi:hypothetical protein
MLNNANICVETINAALKDHQITTDWSKQDLMRDLHIWSERFRFGFKLKSNDPAIMIDRIGRTKYGHFRSGRNGFGLRNEIAINETNIPCQEYWEILGTLLHELLHAEQEQSGKPGKNNYHNKAFRTRAKSLGLIIDEWGYTQYLPAPSPFFNILKKYDITTPIIPEPKIKVVKPGNSKLKLWICRCQPIPVRVRVAIKDFQAKCLKCGHNFIMQN